MESNQWLSRAGGGGGADYKRAEQSQEILGL